MACADHAQITEHAPFWAASYCRVWPHVARGGYILGGRVGNIAKIYSMPANDTLSKMLASDQHGNF